jgi:hypothetical protein
MRFEEPSELFPDEMEYPIIFEGSETIVKCGNNTKLYSVVELDVMNYIEEP